MPDFDFDKEDGGYNVMKGKLNWDSWLALCNFYAPRSLLIVLSLMIMIKGELITINIPWINSITQFFRTKIDFYACH